MEHHTREHQTLERRIEAIDCGRAVALLLSDAARMITGQVQRVDSGLTCMAVNKRLV